MATAKKAIPAKTPPRKAASRKMTPRKPAAKPAVRATLPAPAVRKAAARPAAPKVAKPEKPKKPKLVRDSFTIPKAEYTVLADLKQRAARAGTPAKKSELLRAGIKALAGMDDAAFSAAVGAVPAIKTGRPAKA